ncbi:MAG: biopolymer transporter ExbD [Planctomycetes bacterium]|nr:biopolymer transporter ExbD [Planctomycetota bacterium]
MSAKKGPSIDENVQLNLVPMVDIMFLLLLFFMLGADMGHRELEDVKLPEADVSSVKEDTTPDERTTVNVYHETRGAKCQVYEALQKAGGTSSQICRDMAHWKVGIRGIDYPLDGVTKSAGPNSDGLSMKEKLFMEAESNRPDPNNKTLSERRLQIRGDEAGPYGVVQRVMNTCAEVGIYKIEIGAATKAPE